MELGLYFTQVLSLVALLTVFVNIITEVVKNTFSLISGSKAINLFVLITSEVFTVIAFIIYFNIMKMTLEWYFIFIFMIVGIMVAYAAMFGYDKLLAYFNGFTDDIDIDNEEDDFKEGK